MAKLKPNKAGGHTLVCKRVVLRDPLRIGSEKPLKIFSKKPVSKKFRRALKKATRRFGENIAPSIKALREGGEF